MRFSDQIRMSLNSLWRRKVRTFLTVLGVLIGTVAIVVMMSIGIGQKAAMEDMIDSSRDLQEITIYSMGRDPSDLPEGMMSTDEDAVELLQGMEYVKAVYPFLTLSVELSSGAYSNFLQVNGVPRAYIDELDWTYEAGHFPDVSEYVPGILPLAIGNEVNYNFYKPNGNTMFFGGPPNGQDREPPDVNMYENPVFGVINDWRPYPEGQEPPPPKKYVFQADAIIGNEPQGWSPYSYDAYTDIEAMKEFLTMAYRGKAWPGQPATKSGKATGNLYFDKIIVESDNLEHTIELAKQLTDMGFQCNTMAKYIQDTQEQAARTQVILGGIGGISLLVAAIGIANTMMMSIYERTKEIGIYKVLGCNIRTIRNLFIIESGMIGLIGGILGLGASYGISYIINQAAMQGGSMGPMYVQAGQKISVIPAWLALGALAFGVLVGMIAGLMPAIRAMRLSPLEAIRTE
ncbi:MAG: ABC transporter permease [Eubacteriales bacterium]|nr:ABC transporter permease [Eubacteriales bacterium]